MKYDKLVRDKIPQIIERKGKKVIYRILNETEYKEYLEKKLDEEVAEFHESGSIDELADIVEVVKALALVLDKNTLKLNDIYFKKNRERGGFEKRLCLIEVEERSENGK